MSVNYIKPQKGFQLEFLSSPADIVIGGGAAGAGKTYALLLEACRHINNSQYGGVIFRRTSPQIRSEGGLWDTSMNIYSFIGGNPKESFLEWHFPEGSKLKFSHLEHEKNKLDWQGAQIPFIGFDELTHFSESMFFYLLSRNRSTSGVKPYVRATCNPDPDSWVRELIDWWIDEDTGYPIKERDGIIRYFIKDGANYIWGESVDEVQEKASYLIEQFETDLVTAEDLIKSITFISGSVYENEELLRVDPSYLANLLAQGEQEKAQLLDGNWNIVITENELYDYYKFKDLFTNTFVEAGRGYISADIALKGSDKFIVGYWEGLRLEDISIIPKSDGKMVIDTIKKFQNQYRVPNSNVVFDNDGVGGFIDGFIVGAKEFKNGASPTMKKAYENMKAQCFFESAEKVNDGKYFISERVANTMYDRTQTVRQRIIKERKAIKRAKPDDDRKLRVIPKEEMKVILGGESPDLMDMFMMREYFEVRPHPRGLVRRN